MSKAFNLNVLLYALSRQYPFYYELLQDIKLIVTKQVPTAGVNFKEGRINIFINPEFMNRLTCKEQVAVMVHEFEHICLEHIKETPEQKKNIAMDIAINQNVKNLPSNCLNLKFFDQFDDTIKSKVIKQANWQHYFNLIPDKYSMGGGKAGEVGKKGETGEGEGSGGVGGQEQFDDHGNFGNGDGVDLGNIDVGGMLSRAYESVQDKGGIPSYITDKIREIHSRKASLNYKQILNSALKKSLIKDAKHDWSRPSKRYGFLSKGTSQNKVPRLAIWLDTSGSIGSRELNEFFGIVDNFSKLCKVDIALNFWNTNVYLKSKYKQNGSKELDYDVQGGGTDIRDTIKHINQQNNDLNLVVTDGMFSEDKVIPRNTMYILTPDGTDHYLNKVRSVKIGGYNGRY